MDILGNVLDTIERLNQPKGSKFRDIVGVFKTRFPELSTAEAAHKVKKALQYAMKKGILRLSSGKFRMATSNLESDEDITGRCVQCGRRRGRRGRSRGRRGRRRRRRSRSRRRRHNAKFSETETDEGDSSMEPQDRGRKRRRKSKRRRSRRRRRTHSMTSSDDGMSSSENVNSGAPPNKLKRKKSGRLSSKNEKGTSDQDDNGSRDGSRASDPSKDDAKYGGTNRSDKGNRGGKVDNSDVDVVN